MIVLSQNTQLGLAEYELNSHAISQQLVRPTNIMSRMNGKKTHTHTHTHWVQLSECKLNILCRFASCTNTPIDHKLFFTTKCVIDLHALLMSKFCEYVQDSAHRAYYCTKVCSRGLDFHRDKKVVGENRGEVWEDP